MKKDFATLCQEIKQCTICAKDLPEGPRPVFQGSPDAKILVAGQAPGRKVHETGVPFDDPSGDRLRDWMGIDKQTFYDEKQIAILPMGFCYPGTGKSGDLPPRPECAAKWRDDLLTHLDKIKLTLIIGQYALAWHLPDNKGKNLTETVNMNNNFIKQDILVLPHPSPRNNIWMKKNPWFAQDVLPLLRDRVRQDLAS